MLRSVCTSGCESPTLYIRRPAVAHAEELRRQLTPETRLAILWVKDVWHQLHSYPDQVSEMDIYDAVLEHGVRTPEQSPNFGRCPFLELRDEVLRSSRQR
jgi:hypothetical protein